MTNYFKEVDFGDKNERTVSKVAEELPDVKTQIKAVRVELGNIMQGKSELIPYGIYPNPRGTGYSNALLAFELNPSRENLEKFLELAKTDISRRVAQEFAKLFDSIYPGVGKEL